MPLPEIKVILKTPAQKSEDQIIKCSLDWTVFKLKTYISENYPSKPPINDQRLIYSGHLLKDSSTLNEIFQPTEQDNSTFTVHLVFSQKDLDEKKNEKERNLSMNNNEMPTSSGSENFSNQSIPNVNISQFSFNLTNDPSVDFANLYLQQMQQYQQMYVNYMTQFLADNNLEQSSQTNIYNTLPFNFPMMMNPMFFNPFLTVQTNLASINPLVQNSLNNSNSNTNGINPNGQQTTNNQATNERLNANNQINNENDMDNQNNGVIDIMNVLWNILIVFSLISASPSRTLFVLTFSFFYYLYQTGFFSLIYFRLFGNLTQNLSYRNLPNNEEQIQQMMDDNLDSVLRRRNLDNNNENSENINNNQPQQNFMIDKFRFFWMVISSLFYSLMPNNGPIVPTN